MIPMSLGHIFMHNLIIFLVRTQGKGGNYFRTSSMKMSVSLYLTKLLSIVRIQRLSLFLLGATASN